MGMRALIYTGAGEVRLEERPQPGDPAAGELLVKLRACGVCGSDVTDWYMTPRAPIILGHEPAGDVIAVGEGVTQFKIGDRVALHHHMPCMVCDLCQHGNYSNCAQFKQTRLYPAGMTEFVRVPAAIVAGDVLKLPDEMPYEVGALIEPIACCVHALDRANIRRGDTVLILGAGFNGIVMALLAPHWGADRVAILEATPVRLERARGIGLHTFNVSAPDVYEQVKAWADGKGPHAVVVTAANNRAIQMGFDLTGIGGTLLLYAPPAPGNPVSFDVNRMFFQEIYVTGSYSAGPFDTRRTLSLLVNGVIDPDVLITHRFRLEQAEQAWHLTKQAGDSLKVMVEM